jgi:hypothetical protein
MQGHPLHKDEENYILAHRKRKFPSVIATELSNKYPEHNGGSRSAYCVKRFLKRQS